MDTEHWKILLTAIEKGSLCAAGEALDYTVSGISRSVAALEKEIGFPLLYRSKQGVVPTPACEQLLPLVRELLFTQEKIEQTAARILGYEQGTIGIGTAYRHYYPWITEVTSRFHELHPGVQFHIVNGTSTDLARQLEHHELDFCIISAREGKHGWLPLCRDPLLAVVPAKHPLAGRESVPLELLLPEPYIQTCPGQDIDSIRFFEHRGVKPNMQFSTMDIQATYAMVGAGLGYAVSNRINSNFTDPAVRHLPIEPPEIIEIGLAYRKEPAPAAQAFLKFVVPRLPCGAEDSQKGKAAE